MLTRTVQLTSYVFFLFSALAWAETHDVNSGRIRPSADVAGQSNQFANPCGVQRPPDNRNPTIPPVPSPVATTPVQPAPAQKNEIATPAKESPASAAGSAPTPLTSAAAASASPLVSTVATDLDHKMSEFFKGKCLRCHDSTAANAPHLFNDGGLPQPGVSHTRLVDVLQGKDLSPSGVMKPLIKRIHAELTPEDRKTISDWAHEKGVDNLDLKPPPKPRPAAALRPDAPPAPENWDDLFKNDFYQKSDLITPQDLANQLHDRTKKRPKIFNIGMTPVNLTKDTKEIGPLDPYAEADVLKKLDAAVKGLSSPEEEVVIYCGCCGSEECPYTAYAAWYLKTHYHLTNVRIVNFDAKETLMKKGPDGKNVWDRAVENAAK